MKLLPLITHAIVTFTDRSMAESTKLYGSMALCFGPGDDSGISGFRLVKASRGQYIWHPPQLASGEMVFHGAVAEELVEKIHQFWTTFMEKTERGGKYGRSFRISQHKVEEVFLSHAD